MSRCKLMTLVVMALAGVAVRYASAARVRVPMGRVPAVQHGIIELRAGLERAGLQIVADGGARADLTISVRVADAGTPADVVPEAAESFAVRGGDDSIEVVGRDPVGAMYACLELAEMLADGRELRELADLKLTAEPFTSVRGIALMLDRAGLEEPREWFRYSTFWQKYLDFLARCRFNWLEIHAGYDSAKGEFFDAFDLLIGRRNAHAKPNIGALRRAVRMAHRRGLRVAFFVRGGPADELELAGKLRVLLNACPQIDAVGFESIATGAPLEAAGGRLVILTPHQGDRAAIAGLPGRLRVNAPFDGGALCLPYQIPVWMGDPAESYRDLTGYPRNYGLVWRMSCGQVHRVFAWADYEFIRRSVLAGRLGEADGFVLEPPMALTSPGERIDRKHKLHDWVFERNARAYELFGRLGYDPDGFKDRWPDRLSATFGAKAGRLIGDAAARASRLVPTIAAAHSQGFGPRNAPELTLGGDGLSGYVSIGPLDTTSMMSIPEMVGNHLNGVSTGKVSPWKIASLLIEESYAASEAIQSASAAIPDGAETPGPEVLERFECLRMDIHAVAALAGYHGRKMLAVIDYEMFRQAGDSERLQMARGQLTLAHRWWKTLAEVAGAHYRAAAGFSWAAEGKKLSAETDKLAAAEAKFEKQTPGPGQPPIIGNVPIRRFAANCRFAFTASVRCAGTPRVTAYYRRSGEGEFNEIEMEQARKNSYVAREAVAIGAEPVEYYLVATSGGVTVTLPERGAEQPFVVRPATDSDPPVIKHGPVDIKPPARNAVIAARITDAAEIESAVVWFKPLPQRLSWQMMVLDEGIDGVRQVSIPVTPEGVMYFIEASDADGNVSRLPDVRKAAPYIVIPAWAPAEQQAKDTEVPPAPKEPPTEPQ